MKEENKRRLRESEKILEECKIAQKDELHICPVCKEPLEGETIELLNPKKEYHKG
jgi:hypothetical protein